MDDGTPLLPFAVERLRWWAQPVGTVRCAAAVVPRGVAEGVATADCVLWDETGAPIARIEGFSVRRAPREAFLREGPSLEARSIFRVQWTAAKAPPTPASLAQRRFVVVADELCPPAGRGGAPTCRRRDLHGDGTVRLVAALDGAEAVICIWTALDDSSASASQAAVDGLAVVHAVMTPSTASACRVGHDRRSCGAG